MIIEFPTRGTDKFNTYGPCDPTGEFKQLLKIEKLKNAIINSVIIKFRVCQ